MKSAYALAAVLLAGSAAAQVTKEQVTEEVRVTATADGFTAPQGIDLQLPRMPRHIGINEGWVTLRFMVDKKGRPYEPTITDSIGNPDLEAIALETFAKWRFEPAKRNGEPMEAAHEVVLTWYSNDNPGARAWFSRIYSEVRKAIETGDRAGADSRLATLKTRTLYESANLSLLRYEYARKWGTEAEQLRLLQRALVGAKAEEYLGTETYLRAMQTRLALEVRTRDFGNAVRTWEKLSTSKLPEAEQAQWHKTIDGILALRNDTTAYTVPGEITTGTSWSYFLFKHQFRIKVESGSLTNVKLRCDGKYLAFMFDPSLQYSVSGADRCNMELLGEHGTRFELTQL